MNDIKFLGGPKRMLAFQKLKVFLGNPGKFCLIVLGGRGTGKHFSIEHAFKEISQNAGLDRCLTQLEFWPSSKVPESTEDLDELFRTHQNQTLIIEDVEQLTRAQQDLLFAALSTSDGTFGIQEKFNLRIAFTSSKDPDALREDENLLVGQFWDRISQLVVSIPSYKDEPENVEKDFHATWRKMRFELTPGYEHFAPIPQNESLRNFLKVNAEKFEGGFRDLDKLACMYFNYRILKYATGKRILDDTEKEIVLEIKADFFHKSQLQSHSENDFSVFQIKPGFTMDDLIGQFKIQVRNWGKREYGTYSNAEKKLRLGQGTMKNWNTRRVTKAHKANFEKGT